MDVQRVFMREGAVPGCDTALIKAGLKQFETILGDKLRPQRMRREIIPLR